MFYSITIAQIFYFVGSMLTISALFSKDMLILQSFYFIASVLMLSAALSTHSTMIIFFNVIYVCVTIYRMIQIYLERSPTILPVELKQLYVQYFSNMTSREFLRFIKLGQKKSIHQGEYLCQEGDLHNELIMMIAGKVAVEKNAKVVCQLLDYSFIGEMRYLTKNPMSASVKALTDVTIIQWSYDSLERLKTIKNETYIKFLEIMGRDMTIKISQQQMVLK